MARPPRRPRQHGPDIQIGFVEALLRRDPDFTEALEVLGDLYSEHGHYPKAVGIDERLVRLRPADPNAHYNLACSLSLNGEFDRAATELALAIELGYRDVGQLNQDPDLADLRDHPAFRKVRAKLKALKAPPA